MTTHLDIFKSAYNAALTQLENNNRFEIQKAAEAAFIAEGGKQEDFDFWLQVFNNLLGQFKQMNQSKSLSALAAELAKEQENKQP